MSDPRRPLRPPFGGPTRRRRAPGAPDPLARDLRAALGADYAAPDEPRYWDAFEARVLAAVRDGAARAATTTSGAIRAVPAAAVEWWHALARWAEPGIAAAAVVVVIAGAVFVDARATAAASRAGSAFRDVLDVPVDPSTPPAPSPNAVLDAGLARAGDDAASDDTADQARARRARLVDELLSGGLARRRTVEDGRRANGLGAHRERGAADGRRGALFPDLLPPE